MSRTRRKPLAVARASAAVLDIAPCAGLVEIDILTQFRTSLLAGTGGSDGRALRHLYSCSSDPSCLLE